MPAHGTELEITAGDALEVRRTIDRERSELTSGVVLDKAWFTVKDDLDDADADAVVQKEITGTNQVGVGQIEDDGAGGTDPVLRFDLTASDTRAIEGARREYDIQVKTDSGEPYTAEIGKTVPTSDVTQTTT